MPQEGTEAWNQFAAYWAAYGYDVKDERCEFFAIPLVLCVCTCWLWAGVLGWCEPGVKAMVRIEGSMPREASRDQHGQPAPEHV